MIKRMKIRTLVLGGILTLLFFFLVFRIYKVQIVDGAKWLELAESRWSASETFQAKRGTITDREGNILAMDAISYNVSINPTVIHASGIQEEVTQALVDILGISKSIVESHLNAKREDGTYYANRELRQGGWQIEKAKAEELEAFKEELKMKLSAKKQSTDTGIYIAETFSRFYPRNGLASQLIGYISLDGENKIGLESTFNEQLTGKDGFINYQKDGKRVQISGSEFEYETAVDGSSIELTLDSDIQHYAEEALRKVVAEYSPKSATAIVADPNTMEILAMANIPEFNPNEYWKSDYANMYNHAVSSLYEPGSTFKIAVLAAAIEEGHFNPDEYYQSGSITVPGEPKPFRDHNRVGWGQITFLDGLKYSSNVAFVKLGFERLGAEKMREYFTHFGFGQKTGIEIPNEAAGTIRFQYNSEVAAASFGQGGVLVTPIQQVAAVAAVANGGELMKPYIVKSITDTKTKTTTITEPTVVRRVISEKSSKLANEYLEQVVSDQTYGTGRNAYIEGYRVAGKTGTAQKVINGEYSSSKYVVSFIGYAPVDDPQLIVYVIVDEPNDSLAGGGRVAAPVFREIMLKSLRKLDIAPNYVSEKMETGVEESNIVTIKVPDVTGMKAVLAKEKLKAAGIMSEYVGEGAIIEQQIPAAGTLVHLSQKVYLMTEAKENISVPDLTGSALRDVVEISALIGAKLTVEGNGYVVSQTVESNEKEKIIHVKLLPMSESGQVETSSELEQEHSEEDQNREEKSSEESNADSEHDQDSDAA